MPAGFLDSLTSLINSLPGVLVAGATWGGIVWKVFEKWETVASENDKIQIWMWVAQPDLATKVETWPTTFARLFDRVFGTKHLSWKCFSRSACASYVLGAWYMLNSLSFGFPLVPIRSVLVVVLIANVVPDYISLLESRYVMGLMRRSQSALVWFGALSLDALMTLAIGWTAYVLSQFIFFGRNGGYTYLAMLKAMVRAWTYSPIAFAPVSIPLFESAGYCLIPAFFTSIWLWLYAGSGVLLKAACRFDIGFQWFNRHFDIEKKPLQSIGLVAGVLVAMVYWAAVIVSRVL